MPLGQVLTGLVSPVLQAITAQGLRGKAPEAPDFRKLNPRGQPGGGLSGPFRNQPVGPGVKQELGLQSWPGQAGQDFVSQKHLQDIARDLGDQKERRVLEEQALGEFTTAFDEGMSRFKGVVDSQFGGTLKEGTQAFGDAIANVQSQYANADLSLTESVAALTSGLKDVKAQRASIMEEMQFAKGEFLSGFIEDTASLVSLEVTQMDARGRAEYEELSGELAASGIPMYQQQQLKWQFRQGISKDIGDVAKGLQTERQFQRETFAREYDSDINNFRINMGMAIADITAATAREIGGAFSEWSTSKQSTAFVEADLRKGFAEWRSTIANNWGILEAQIRSHEFAGRTIIADQMRSLTIPTFRLGPLADAQLAYQNNEAQVNWSNKQAEFGITSGIDTFELAGWQNAFQSIADYEIAMEQIESEERQAERANNYGLASAALGAGGSIGAGFAGRK